MAWVPGGNQVTGPDLVAAALPLLTFMELASRLFAFLHHDPLDSSQFFLGALQVFAKLFFECRATAMLTIDTLQEVMVPAGLIAFLRKIVFDVINPPVVLRPAVLGPGWDREGCPKQAPGGEQHNANRQSQPPGDVGQNVGSVFSTIIFKKRWMHIFLLRHFMYLSGYQIAILAGQDTVCFMGPRRVRLKSWVPTRMGSPSSGSGRRHLCRPQADGSLHQHLGQAQTGSCALGSPRAPSRSQARGAGASLLRPHAPSPAAGFARWPSTAL